MSEPPDPGVITQAIERLRSGDDSAASELWQYCFKPLVRTARRRLAGRPLRVSDEEDLALSVFKSFCLGVPKGRFTELKNRHDLWTLLLRILERKAVDHWRYENRQCRGGDVVVVGMDSEIRGLDQLPAAVSLPQFLSVLTETVEQLRDESLRTVAVLHLQGYSTQEISELIGMTVRSVQRKLNLIRDQWEQETGP